MKVLMFQDRFAELVSTERKLQTVRPMPKRMIYPGTPLSLRRWTGKPYRSKQEVLRTVILIDHALFQITTTDRFYLNGRLMLYAAMDEFAIADGFTNAHEMLAWFRQTHGPGHFKGVAYLWNPASLEGLTPKQPNPLLIDHG